MFDGYHGIAVLIRSLLFDLSQRKFSTTTRTCPLAPNHRSRDIKSLPPPLFHSVDKRNCSFKYTVSILSKLLRGPSSCPHTFTLKYTYPLRDLKVNIPSLSRYYPLRVNERLRLYNHWRARIRVDITSVLGYVIPYRDVRNILSMLGGLKHSEIKTNCVTYMK